MISDPMTINKHEGQFTCTFLDQIFKSMKIDSLLSVNERL